MKLSLKIICLLASFLFLLTVPCVYATWYYFANPVADQNTSFSNVSTQPYYPSWDGEELLTSEEMGVVNCFAREINDENSEIHTYIANRTDSAWLPRRELGSMDEIYSNEMRAMFGIEDSDIEVMIRFIYANNGTYFWGGDIVGYEVYTTTVDLYSSRYTEANFANENGTVYPVTKSTYTVDANGDLKPLKSQVGYTPTYYYYDTETAQKTTIRSFNILLWKAGQP